MATNIKALQIDFSSYDRDFRAEIDEKILSQFYKSTVFKAVMGAFADECQELYDAITEMRKQRCIAYATGTNLDALGRIVGQERVQYAYTGDIYFTPDVENRSVDQGIAYVKNAPIADTLVPDDNQYRLQILAKTQNNMNRFSSIPELIQQVTLALGIPVSVNITAPATVNIVVTSAASDSDKYFLTLKRNTVQTEDSYFFPYPAGIKIAGVVVETP